MPVASALSQIGGLDRDGISAHLRNTLDTGVVYTPRQSLHVANLIDVLAREDTLRWLGLLAG
jgi:hypothetical protein